MTQNIWKGHLSKHLAEKYSICHTNDRSKIFSEQRFKKIEKHLQQAYNAIQQFEKEILSKGSCDDTCFSTMKKVSSIIHEFVQEKQWLLQHGFQYKRKMLILDAPDHQLVQKLFDTKPNKSYVRMYAIIYVTIFHTFLNLISF